MRCHVGFKSLEYGEFVFETNLDCSDLSYDRVGVDSCTPETALRAFDAKELAVEDDGGFHVRLPARLCATRLIEFVGMAMASVGAFRHAVAVPTEL